MILFICILTLFFVYSPVYAFDISTYQKSPVIIKDKTSEAVTQPFIMKNGSTFTAYFADYVNSRSYVSVMRSANGIDWYDKKILQLVSSGHVGDPYMAQIDNSYRLYFSSPNGGRLAIWQSTSQDGITFTPGQEQQIVIPEQQYPWEYKNISCPAYFKEGDTHYLLYCGEGTISWAVGMATSTDGKTWQKCANNPLFFDAGSPQIIKFNNLFYLFYHSSVGLTVWETSVMNGCNTAWTNKRILQPPSTAFLDPSPLVVGNELWIYGTQYGLPVSPAIGLATSNTIYPPTYPIVIIPGMFASWNKQAILHNGETDFSAWKLNPAVSEYDGLKTALQNDAYIFPYDWRRLILETTNDLDAYLQSTFWDANPYQPIQIVGHSLGGVVSRVYADKNPSKPIKQIVTAGSPHLGLVQTYKPLEEGNIDREDTLVWLAQKLILYLNKPLFQTNKETIVQKFPVLFDLLPTFSFLKNDSGSFITSPLVNALHSQYPILSSPHIPQYYIGGSGTQTLAGFTPNNSWKEDGDGVTLLKSSLNQVTPAPVQNHGELIYTKEGVQAILENLGRHLPLEQITPGKATAIFPAIFVFLQSPATASITHNGVTTEEKDGLIWLQNTVNGEYFLQVVGTDSGEYTVSFWLIGADDDKWIQYKKMTTTGRIDKYVITFDNSTGGLATEFFPPTPTSTPYPLTPTPSQKPNPTKKPCPTKKPTPTKVPSNQHHNSRLGRLIQIIIRYIVQLRRK